MTGFERGDVIAEAAGAAKQSARAADAAEEAAAAAKQSAVGAARSAEAAERANRKATFLLILSAMALVISFAAFIAPLMR